jgi:hypothetical protein
MFAKYFTTVDNVVIFRNIPQGGLQHDEVAKGIMSGGRKIVSAGFVQFEYDAEKHWMTAMCFGESQTLGVSSQPDRDKQMIEEMLNEY